MVTTTEKWPLTGDEEELKRRLSDATSLFGLGVRYDDDGRVAEYAALSPLESMVAAAELLNIIRELRARLDEAEYRIELAYNALWNETDDDNTKILLASHYLMNGDPADDDDD